ncbi:hypothetical protein AAHH78_40815, partial [Burkholderia pseudomallei]
FATGDPVRLDDTGRLPCVGRAADQVHIRGFRVEPREVEAVLATHPGVAHCQVLAFERDPSGKLLAAYAAGDASLTEAA